ncbi:KilA-N domain-containing protein [Lactovum odontotermitis]
MAKQIKNKIEAQGLEISVLTQNQNDFISLTDIAKYRNKESPALVIANWLSNYSTIDFLATWEELSNPNFKLLEFQELRNERGRLSLSPKQWIERVNATGLKSSSGRYGGTFAHTDIAFEFASWVSPEFKLYVIKDYQRLKQSESFQNQIEWNVKRELAKATYSLHTDAVKNFLIPTLTAAQIKYAYANEADMLNVALFGMTAKQFREKYPDRTGNQRDNATIEQNIVMVNLETSNALLIEQGLSQSERLKMLRNLAVKQFETYSNNRAIQRIKNISDNQERQLKG